VSACVTRNVPVTAELSHGGVPLGSDDVLDDAPYVAVLLPGLAERDSRPKTLIRGDHQILHFVGDVPDEYRLGAVSVHTVVEHRHVYIDYVPVLNYRRVGDAVAYYLLLVSMFMSIYTEGNKSKVSDPYSDTWYPERL
jgi:hypothetical protein